MSSLTGINTANGTLTPSTNVSPGQLTPVSVGTVGPKGDQGPQGVPGPAGPASTVPGPQGPIGQTGLRGLQGVMGIQGVSGNTIISSNGVPANTVGNNGDYFYDTNGHILWGPKASGAWPPTGIPLIGPSGGVGPQGPAGTMGINGNTILNGSGPPPGTVGVAGDYYLDNSKSNLYGPRTASGWPGTFTSLIGPQGVQGPVGPASTVPGPQGPAGTSIDNGAGPPANSVGGNGDVYYDTANLRLYGPKSGTWPSNYVNLVGPQGVAGNTILNGTAAPTNGVGNNGDFFLNTTNETLYGPKSSGAWPANGVSLIGPQGQTGATGAASTVPGPQGNAGQNGNTILNGSANPTSAQGVVGDFYLNTTSEVLFGPKTSSGWPSTGVSLIGPMGQTGSQGSQGVAGTNGNTVRSGSGAPANSLGVQNDFYIDTVAENIYGPKGASSWPTPGVSLIGPTGPQGAVGYQVLSGSGAPSNSLGRNGDIYVDTFNGNLYPAKANNVWGNVTSLVGPSGPSGAAGTNGNTIQNGSGAPANTLGVNGDYYIDNTNYRLYGPKASGQWPTTYQSLIGPMGAQGQQGTAGTAGTNGTNGNTILNGTILPANSVGNNGDFYLKTDTEVLYGPKANGVWPSTGTALIGPQGAMGSTGSVGPAGTSIDTGSGPPTSSIGNNGDIYLDTTNYNLYGPKASGSWPNTYKSLVGPQGSMGSTGATGSQGVQGTPGNTILNGTASPPANTLGNNGDFYLNTSSDVLYGPKASGSWPSTGVTLIGQQGATGSMGASGTNGNTVLNGTSNPTSSQGVNGDFYINTSTNYIYGPKANGAWPSTGTSLVGPQGQKGDTGATGATGAQGPAGSGLGNDPTANSLVLGPVALDANAVQLRLNAANSVQKFLVDANGNITGAGTATITGAIVGASIDTANGTTGAPAYGFQNQTDTGMFLNTASTSAAVLGFAVNGSQTITTSKTATAITGNATVSGTCAVTGLTTAATLQAGTGTAAAPTHSFTTQTDTGMFINNVSTSAAQIGFSTNGTIRMSLNNSTAGFANAVTIGAGLTVTGSISASTYVLGNVLAVNANGSATAPAIYSNNYATTGIYFSSTPALIVTAGGTAVASFNAASLNVAQALNAQSTLTVTGAATCNGTLQVNNSLTATGQILGKQGTAASPSWATSYDTGTGIYIGTTGVLNLTTSKTAKSMAQFSSDATSISAGTITMNGDLSTTANSSTGNAGNLSVAGTSSMAGTVTSTTAAGVPSFVSSQGFKAIGPTFYYWVNGTSQSANYIFMAMPVVAMAATQTASYVAGSWVAPRAGSITGFSAGFDRSNSTTFVFRCTIAGNATAQMLSASANSSATFAKGTYSFTAGQVIGIQCGPLAAASPSVVIFANFEVELGA